MATAELPMLKTKDYLGYVADVSDGEAMILLGAVLDEDGHLDWPRTLEAHDGENPDYITLTAERWMQPGTRLNISIALHPNDHPVVGIRTRE